jgi:hypothetical protein
VLRAETEPDATLVLRLRPSRRKAPAAAIAEVLALLRGLGARQAPGGPLSELSGIAWVKVPTEHVTSAASRLQGLGYTSAVELVRPAASPDPRGPRVVRWRGQNVELLPLYEEPEESLRAAAPDRRTFLLEGGDGIIRPTAGYRGGPGALEHRALPVVDARLLVNLVMTPGRGLLLDPFAGAGGVVIEACARDWTALSLDIDPRLRIGLAQLAALHVVGDATALPIATASIAAVATEPPYHPSARFAVIESIAEVARVLRPGGRAAFLVASTQASTLRAAGDSAGLKLELDVAINRKGTDVSCLCWIR